MYKQFYMLFFLLAFSLVSFAKKFAPENSYKFTIDLDHVTDDKVPVELITPKISTTTITYHVPKIIPGTYSEDDFGRYIEGFKAFDKKGDTLKVEKSDVNSWVISNAVKLYKISYWVNDSYDDSTTKQVIFEPAGSNIQKDTNYVINNNCFLGYFDNMKNVTYEVNIQHPATLYGSTALTDVDNSNTSDKFITESYNRIVDNPFMYCAPDTSVIKVGTTDVLISVYSPTKQVTSKFLAQKLDTLLQAQGKYLGGKLPVDKYAFLIYLDAKQFGYSGGEGALEHSYCSMYYYPERPAEQLSQEFEDHAAHEFFHIITPLTIHSNEIQNFDFNTPKMSQHLWLYEGSTEYHAQMVQEKYGLISADDLLKRFSGKITNSKTNYNDTVPFTIMSSHVLQEYKKQFGNVYQKGALINMCLDIKLLQLSDGKYGIMNLIHDLSNKYGKQKGFVDDSLFNEIGRLTYPQIQQFLETYVGGATPLPLEDIFNIIGVKFQKELETKDSTFSLGRAGFGFNPETNRLFISNLSGLNEFGKTIGYHLKDEVVSINGVAITGANVNQFFKDFGKNSNSGDSLIIKVIRKDENGNDAETELRALMTKLPIKKYNVLSFDDNATQQQLALREAWLKPR